MKRLKRLSRLVFIGIGISSMLFSSVNVSAADTTFFGTNDIIYYDPDACTTDGAATGSSTIAPYKNPVIDSNAPDPSIIRADDGKYYLFTTGFQQFVSDDMVHWKKLNDGISWIKNNPGWSTDRWAPDIVKIDDTYILTISGRTSGNRKIGYATSSSAAGPFTYQGELLNSSDRGKNGMGYDIDPNVINTDQGIYLYYGSGRGTISSAKLTKSGNKLTAARSKVIFTTSEGKAPVLAEGAYVYKKDNYYYLFYSSGDYKQSSNPPYRVHVARSTSPTGPFKQKGSPILEGNSSFTHPGHNSAINDGAGNDYIVYHAYPKGKDYRAVLVDKMTFENGWPVINGGKGPSSTQQSGSTGNTTPSSGGVGHAPDGQVKVAQANIKVSSPDAAFKSELDRVIGTNPDFVSGNEWSSRTDNQIKRPGYDFYRGDSGGVPARKSEGYVVMWKSDKWKKVASGTVVMTRESDITYNSPNEVARNSDGKRSMAWVTLQDSSGGKVSFITTHHMVNPNKYLPKDERKALYKLGLERAVVKIKELQGTGPVIMAGDFNAQIHDDGPWHPRQVLGKIGMESTHDSLPKVAAAVDYIFYTKNDIKPISHAVPFQLYDHPFLTATLQFQGNTTYSGAAAPSGQCVCEGQSSSPSLLAGSDNEEKAWNFLTGKGLSAEQAAGIMGNIYVESKFDPIADNNGNYKGISQWDTGGRWATFVKWAKQQGLDELSFDAQMQYTYKEGDDRKNIEGIKKYDDVPHTAWYWGRYFEVAIINGSTSDTPLTNVQSLSERTEAAQKYFDKYKGTVGSSTGGSSAGTSADCPSSDGSLANAVCSNVDAKPPDDFGRTTFPGTSEKTDKRTLYMVNLANDCLKAIGEKPITVVQGSYCAGGCAGASGSSHDKGATLDIRTRDRGGKDKIMKLLKVLREVGFAAWYRDGGDNPSFAGNEHIHAVALGAPLTGANAPGSPDQLILYCQGGDGLVGGQKDRQLATVGRPLPEWALQVKPDCTRYPK